MSLELAVIVLNYRTPDMTVECLETLAGEMAPGRAVVVVDNASGDGSGARIQRAITDRGWSDWARVIESPVNGGFAAGNNVGIRAVEADAYLLLNSDTLVRPGALRSLIEAMRAHPEAGLIGSGLLGVDGAREHSAFRHITPLTELIRGANLGPLTRLLARVHVVPPLSDAPGEAGWVSFACVLVRREVVQEVGYLDEGFFMYYEDVDYCRRTLASGWRILTWPESKVVHLGGSSSEFSNIEQARRRAPRYFYEARSRYFAKYYGRAGLWLANLLWCCGHALSWLRVPFGRAPVHRQGEPIDIWINAARPLRERALAR